MYLVCTYNKIERDEVDEHKMHFKNDILFTWINANLTNKNFYNSDGGWCYVYKNFSKDNITLDQNLAENLFKKYFKENACPSSDITDKTLVIIFDRKKQSLFIFRDVIGLQHVFYTHIDDSFFVSTSIDPIIKFVGKNKLILSESSLALYLSLQYLPSPYTVFEKIFQMPLNTVMEYSKQSIFFHTVPSSLFNSPDHEWTSSQNGIKQILVDSALRQLSTNGGASKKIGAFLSGGIDTTVNVSLLVEEIGIKPVVFTASFDNPIYDETRFAEIVSNKYGLVHEKVPIKNDIVNYLLDCVSVFDNPMADRAALPQYLISKKAFEQGITHMVSGEGGDEIMGYPRNLPESLVPGNQYENFELADLYLGFSALADKQLIAELLNLKNEINKGREVLGSIYSELGIKNSFEKILYGQWRTWLIEDVYLKDLQIFERFSLFYVAPFIDYNLLRHMVLQDSVKKPDMVRNKSYLKQNLKKLLPREILDKKKHKFHVPVAEWFRQEWFGLLQENLLSRGSFAYNNFDHEVIEQMLIQHKSGACDHNRVLWALLVLEFWFKSKMT